MNYVNFEEVVSESITAIGADGNDETAKLFARQFLWRGLQSLGNSDERIAVCSITPKNLLAKKPKDLKQIIDVALYDANDNLLPHVWHTGKSRIYPQTDAVIYTSTNDEGESEYTFFGPIDISEDQYNIVIGTNGGSNVATVKIRYWQYPLDANNLPIIREDEVEALILYVRYRWSMRQNLNQSEIRENRMAWMQAADQIKGLKKSFNNEQAKTSARLLNRMIPNFNRSQF